MLNKTVQMKVNGITCGGCVNKIKKSLIATNIEHTVDIDVESGAVKVQFNSNEGSLSLIKDSIIKAGFQVEKIELQ